MNRNSGKRSIGGIKAVPYIHHHGIGYGFYSKVYIKWNFVLKGIGKVIYVKFFKYFIAKWILKIFSVSFTFKT